MTQERELKLVAPTIGLPDLAQRLQTLQGGRKPRSLELVTTYFDTGGEDLRKAGVSLRIRRQGAKRTQTLKSGSVRGAGLFERSERERTVKSDAPALNADEAKALEEALGAPLDPDRPLVAVFTVRARRKVFVIAHDGAEIEAVIDDAEARVAEDSVAFQEVELELRSGEPAALFSLARELGRTAPLRIGVETKASRGYQLRRGEKVSSVKAGRAPIVHDMTVCAAFVAIIASNLEQFRRNEDLFLAGPQAEPLHQARVALRRMRSAFKSFRPLVGGMDGGLAVELKWLANSLGAARDLDVFGAAQGLDAEQSEEAAAHLADHLALARAEAYAKALNALNSPRALKTMIDLAEWSHHGAWTTDAIRTPLRDGPVEEFAAATLDKALKRFRKKSRGLKKLSDEERHDARIRAKTLRYAAEFFGGLYVKDERKAYLRPLKDLQGSLGALNDIATARQLTHDLAIEAGEAHDGEAAYAAGRLSSEVEAPAKALLDEAAGHLKALKKAKPFWKG